MTQATMPGWHVIVPFRQGSAGKSRLAPLMGEADRATMALDMARHVMAELAMLREIASLAVLAPHRPDWWGGSWVRDEGRGLNPELEAWRGGLAGQPMLVIHADLPLLAAAEVLELLAAAALPGAALAPDYAGTGTNALAIADGRRFAFRFGVDSCALHLAQARDIAVVRRAGLMTDIDTPDDIARLQSIRSASRS